MLLTKFGSDNQIHTVMPTKFQPHIYVTTAKFNQTNLVSSRKTNKVFGNINNELRVNFLTELALIDFCANFYFKLVVCQFYTCSLCSGFSIEVAVYLVAPFNEKLERKTKRFLSRGSVISRYQNKRSAVLRYFGVMFGLIGIPIREHR